MGVKLVYIAAPKSILYHVPPIFIQNLFIVLLNAITALETTGKYELIEDVSIVATSLIALFASNLS